MRAVPVFLMFGRGRRGSGARILTRLGQQLGGGGGAAVLAEAVDEFGDQGVEAVEHRGEGAGDYLDSRW